MQYVGGCNLWVGAICGWLQFVSGCNLWTGAICGWVHFVDGCSLWMGAVCGCMQYKAVILLVVVSILVGYSGCSFLRRNCVQFSLIG